MFNKDTFKDLTDGDYFVGLGKVNEGEYQGYKYSIRKLYYITVKDGEFRTNNISIKTQLCEDYKLSDLECGQKIYMFFDRFGKVACINPI